MAAHAPRRNHWLWAGPLITVVGSLSYWVIFAKWPLTRDVPWVNLLAIAGGLGLTGLGLRRAWPRGGWRLWAAGGGGALLALAASALLVWYCFVWSYEMPTPGAASDVGAPAPALTVATADGSTVDLAAAAQGRLVLVFYRGYW